MQVRYQAAPRPDGVKLLLLLGNQAKHLLMRYHVYSPHLPLGATEGATDAFGQTGKSTQIRRQGCSQVR